MIGSHAITLCFTLLLGTSNALTIAPLEFQRWFEAASNRDLRIPKSVEKNAQGFRYVFIGGFHGEHMSGYFVQNAKELRKHGVSKRSIHYIFPSSDKTVEENQDSVRTELTKIAETGSERLVVIAHSRGACDALAFALRNPQFVEDRIEAFFLVQGPFGGTGLADYLLGEGEPMDRRMPAVPRLLAHVLGKIEKALLARGNHAGLAGLTRDASRLYWKQALEEHADSVAIVGPRVFYIESQARPSRLLLFQRVLARYLRTYYGMNDGLVTVSDQSLPWLGTRLGTFEAGHADLTRRFPASKVGRYARRALVQSILMAVGGGSAGSCPDGSKSLGMFSGSKNQ